MPEVIMPDDQTPPPQPQSAPQPPAAESGWNYAPEPAATANNAPTNGPNIDVLTWSASEFINHDKSPGWFVVLGIGTAVLAAAIFLITHSIFTAVIIVIIAVLFGIVATQAPRTLQYTIDRRGIKIENKLYPYETFRSFSVLREGAFSSIQLQPLKRFAIPLSLYYPPEQEDNVINTLGSYLPHEERRRDPVDSLMRKVRF